jgi:hypothetical protein
VKDATLGCFSDSFTRTFPTIVSYGPADPFYQNQTLETCAYLCNNLHNGTFNVAAVENGGQCLCSSAANVSAAAKNLKPLADCNVSCHGNPLQRCGGPWRAMAYNFTCMPYKPHGAWQNSSLPVKNRVHDLVSRMDSEQLIAQLTQNGADLYSHSFQLPRYIVSQECLAGFDGGSIFLAPQLPSVRSSAFPQPVNMGNSWDADLVRDIASAISDEARAAFNHGGRPSLTCMSPNLNVNRDPRCVPIPHPIYTIEGLA